MGTLWEEVVKDFKNAVQGATNHLVLRRLSTLPESESCDNESFETTMVVFVVHATLDWAGFPTYWNLQCPCFSTKLAVQLDANLGAHTHQHLFLRQGSWDHHLWGHWKNKPSLLWVLHSWEFNKDTGSTLLPILTTKTRYCRSLKYHICLDLRMLEMQLIWALITWPFQAAQLLDCIITVLSVGGHDCDYHLSSIIQLGLDLI